MMLEPRDKSTHSRQGSDAVPSKICQECGCTCRGRFIDTTNLDLHQQIVELESQLRKSNSHISKIGHELIDSQQAAEYEVLKLREELGKLRDRYDRLFESHKRIQKVNHGLEDKLLKVVNGFEVEKMTLQKEVASITSKLVDAKVTVCELEEENERYRNDVNIAVQLLQCRPSDFVAHKLLSLPPDLQERVKKHMTPKQVINSEDSPQTNDTQMIRIPMATFPPTAMVYSVNSVPTKVSNGQDGSRTDCDNTVPMNLITKVLTPSEPRRKPRRTYICLNCKRDVVLHDKDVQVNMSRDRTGSCEGLSGLRVHKPSGRVRTNSTETDF